MVGNCVSDWQIHRKVVGELGREIGEHMGEWMSGQVSDQACA